ncbi:MAG: hypothetical protein ACP5JJ_14115 [Anaerolineae bacterium]
MASQLVFGRVAMETQAERRRSTPEVKVLYFRSLFDAGEDHRKVILPPTEQRVQLAMSAI